jgi:hypothetical protein
MAFDLFKKVTEKLQKESNNPSGDFPEFAVPKDIRSFLGQLGILKNIPIYYLIPDEKYLPQTIENEGGVLKLFWLDKEWIECLFDGALSLGGGEDRQFLLSKAMAGNYVAEVYYEETKERIKKQLKGSYSPSEFKTQFDARIKRKNITFFKNGAPKPTVAQNNWCYTGFLIRSTLISAWVGIEVIAKGYDKLNKKDTPARSLQVIRLERLSSDTLFCLCEGIIQQVEIVQPPEAFHFGVKKDSGFYQVNNTEVKFRKKAGVINVKELQSSLGVTDSANFAKVMAIKSLKVDIDINWFAPLQSVD